jgi:hypothetical protein
MDTLRRHWGMALLFVALSCADLALTAHLLRLGGGQVYEANWLAAEVLARHGVVGLAVFKGLAVLLVGALVATVASARPRGAQRLVGFACLAVGGVVLYSLMLWGRVAAQALPGDPRLANSKGERVRLKQAACTREEYVALWKYWAAALAEGRCTVRAAVTALADFASARSVGFLEGHQNVMRVNSQAECLAGLAVGEALRLLRADGSPAARARADHLLAVCRADYGPAVSAYLREGVLKPQDRSAGEPPYEDDVVSLSLSSGLPGGFRR